MSKKTKIIIIIFTVFLIIATTIMISIYQANKKAQFPQIQDQSLITQESNSFIHNGPYLSIAGDYSLDKDQEALGQNRAIIWITIEPQGNVIFTIYDPITNEYQDLDGTIVGQNNSLIIRNKDDGATNQFSFENNQLRDLENDFLYKQELNWQQKYEMFLIDEAFQKTGTTSGIRITD